MAVTRDPFLVEVVKDALTAVGDEMFVTLERTSMSPIIYEVLDFATGLTDRDGQLITQGNGVASFIGTLGAAVRSVLEKHGDGLAEGDLIITNDVYGGGGTHLSDVTLVLPIFDDGELVAFAASKAHWTEVGGMAPGSWTTDSTEIYQEGLQFPCIKLYDRGTPNQALLELIEANVRLPEMTLGDLHAQAAAMRVGERRMRETCARYGREVVLDAIEATLDHAEALTRLELARLPKGTFHAVEFVDDDGMGNGPFRVQVAVTISDDRFVCDFTGTDPQAVGPINCSRAGLFCSVRLLFKSITDPSIPANDGCFRPLEIICPDGTLITAMRPAPTSCNWEARTFGAEAVWHALAPHVPERLPAGHQVSVCGTVLAGTHPETGGLFLMVEPQAGGWGACEARDGVQGNFCVGNGETFLIPIEVAETRYAVRFRRFALEARDAGAGRHRGGAGCVREYESTTDDLTVTATTGRHRFPPWGAEGGQDGSPNAVELVRADGSVERSGKLARARLAKGEAFRVLTATGGGWGDPYERPVEDVVADVRDGYVTLDVAARRYGVVLDPTTLEVLRPIGHAPRGQLARPRVEPLRVAVDIGGTFTDLVRLDEATGEVALAKAATTPRAFEQGVLDAVSQTELGDVGFLAHGTTVVINALTERKGATVGLLTTEGFRDVLEIARGEPARPVQPGLREAAAVRPAPAAARGARAARPPGPAWSPRSTRSRPARPSASCASRASRRSRSASCTPTRTPTTSGGWRRSWPRSGPRSTCPCRTS